MCTVLVSCVWIFYKTAGVPRMMWLLFWPAFRGELNNSLLSSIKVFLTLWWQSTQRPQYFFPSQCRGVKLVQRQPPRVRQTSAWDRGEELGGLNSEISAYDWQPFWLHLSMLMLSVLFRPSEQTFPTWIASVSLRPCTARSLWRDSPRLVYKCYQCYYALVWFCCSTTTFYCNLLIRSIFVWLQTYAAVV